ncbi:DUF11 domain-containing protein [Piscinibacter sp. HJYY11]|uniref:DUF11 domain-containing protein n=1 Tax=Piscinibacter sp. HJYY11 TaxID=2801333 RepID=UPI00191CC825|nr:DUF11 domain-containing protein [Piscinibacter sp. HJYY11]MBL0730016.1 hypothetical protein [Piscinibacter sp. HJYY11]
MSIAIEPGANPAPVAEPHWFDMVVTNEGPDEASDVSVQTHRPDALSPIDVMCFASQGATCPASAETLRVAALPVGGVLRYRVFVRQNQRGSTRFTARVTAANDMLVRSNDSAHIDLRAYSADLQVSGTAPALETSAGAPISYTMSVTNAGPDPAVRVAIHNFVDAEQLLQGVTCTADGGATCPAVVGAAMSVPELPVGASLHFSVTALPWPGTVGPVTNKLYVSALGDPFVYDNSAVASARVAIPANPGSLVVLESDPGDFVLQGERHVYDQANAMLVFEPDSSTLSVRVIADELWDGRFQLPGNLAQFAPGTYLNLNRLTVPSAAGGLFWSGEGRSCSSVNGSIVVDQVTYSGSTPTLIDLRFEQRCEGSAAALRGRVRWVARDSTQPPAPIVPPPTGLWRAPSGAVPADGSFLYLHRAPSDPVLGNAATRLFTRSDSVMQVDADGRRLEIRVNGDETWHLDFTTMQNLTLLQPGFYRGVSLAGNPARGRFFSSLQACERPSGWVVIDEVTYTGGALSSLSLRFEQQCVNNVSVFRGQARWLASDTTEPPGPQVPPPGLWQPTAGSTPGTGNYVYLESDAGDYIGQGMTRLFTAPESPIRVTAYVDRSVRVLVGNDRSWDGEFYPMSSLPRLAPGFYFGVFRAPFHNPAKGGMEWSGEGRACNDLWGWFMVDSVTYAGDEITSLEMRFEQHCEFSEPALRGKVRWVR